MGLRFLAVAALFLLLVFLFRNRWARLRDSNPSSTRSPVQPTVKCAQCGAFVAKSEAIHHDTAWYCSPEHVPNSTTDESQSGG